MLLVQTCQMVALADLTDARGPNTFSRNGRNGFRSRRRLRSLAGRKSMTEKASSWQTYASIWTTILFTIGSVAVEMLVGLAGSACLAAVTLSLVGRFASVLK